MGKEWLYHWGGGGGGGGGSRSKKRGGSKTFSCSSGGDSGSVVSNSTNSSSSTSTPSGCINAVIQLFDFHPFHFSSHLHHQSLSHEPTANVPLKGAEAPRNSLDIHDGTHFMEAATLNRNKDETLHFEKDMLQIKTSGHTISSFRGENDKYSTFSSSNSPGGTKTPTLVARLMGLDLLPDTSSPRLSSSSSLALNKKKASTCSFSESHSMPVTPRTSATRSDIEQRFSLQANKENNDVGSCQELDFSRFLKSKINAARMHEEDENMSPGHYAKQIVKQYFKESVSRRVGKDITNTVTNHDYERKDQNVVLLKQKKPSNLGHGSETTTKSPRLRLLETKSKPETIKSNQNKKSKVVSLRSKAVLIPREEKHKQKCSRTKFKLVIHGDENMKCSSKFKKPPQTLDLMRTKQEEAFVRSARASQTAGKKCKTTPLPSLLSLKNKELKRQKKFYDSEASDPPSSKTNTQMLSCKLSQSYKQVLNDQNSLMGAEQLSDYISRILNCTGIFHYTPVSILNFNSPSHPLHPSIFHQLPKLHNGKLVFELVDHLLAGILQPCSGNYSSFIRSKRFMLGEQLKCYTRCTKQMIPKVLPMDGECLLHLLLDTIKNFPSVNCLVLDDIDALVDKDLPPKLLEYREEQVEGMVMEIEGYILERLVHETVTLVGVRTA